jgi:hypothetical protein
MVQGGSVLVASRGDLGARGRLRGNGRVRCSEAVSIHADVNSIVSLAVGQ